MEEQKSDSAETPRTKEHHYMNDNLMSKLRRIGLGIKIASDGEVVFYNDEHKNMFERVTGVFQQGKEISSDSVRKIQDLLGDFDNPVKLVDDLDFGIWLLEAEKVSFKCSHDIVTKGIKGEDIEPRTAPFMFDKQDEAKEWYKIFTNIGLKPQWQPGEPKHFWLAQRPPRRKKHNRTKRHEISNTLESLNVKGHPNDTEYYYQNSVQRSHCFVMHKTATKDERSKFIEDLVVKLCEKMPEWKFILNSKKTGFHYVNLNEPPAGEEVCDEQNNEQEKSQSDDFIKMFSEQQWIHLLQYAPKEIVAKFFGEPEDKYKKILEQIQANYVLVNKDNPMIPGIKAMKPEDVKEISNFMS